MLQEFINPCRSSTLRWVAAPLLVFATALIPNFAQAGVVITAVGNAGFSVVDTHIYAAPTNSFPSLFPDHFTGGSPDRKVHSGYDGEYAAGLALSGFHQGEVFSEAEITAPNAIHLGYVLVPNASAPSGSSFDFANGPIIPRSNSPITIQGEVFLNGVLFESGPGAFGLSLTAEPNLALDGNSHFVVEQWENSSFARPGLTSLVGNYEYRLTVRDTAGAGYDMNASFSVVPEPSMLAPLGMLLAGYVGSRRRRRSLTN